MHVNKIAVPKRHFLPAELGEFVSVRPPEQRVDENWYMGTADAIYQNIYTIEKVRPKHIVILSGDHIYRMDYSKFIGDHIVEKQRLVADRRVLASGIGARELEQFVHVLRDGAQLVVDRA